MKKLFPAFICLTLGFIGVSSAFAAAPVEHPHYLHALSDLRYARALLETGSEHNNVYDKEEKAVHEIDEAIAEIKKAAIDDGKDLKDHPGIDANVTHMDKLNKARALLTSAEHDLHAVEGDKKTLGWRIKAIHEVGSAHQLVVMAEKQERKDKK